MCKDDVKKGKNAKESMIYLAALFRIFIQNSSTISELYTIRARISADVLLVC